MKKEIKTRKIKVRDSIEILKEFFPQCFDKFGNFNLEKFQKEIKRNEINISKENYGLEWLGKSYARVRTFDPARTLLKENEKWNKKDENKNSQNVLIKGDNLEVLKHLSNAYHKKIKMIYIDPPYNTGKDDFVYSDDRKFTIEEFMELAGVSEERAKRVLEFVNSKSNSHSAWLTFMYPRLYLARKLLKDDGVIFVSIDDNEVAQLRLLMDEVFGEGNFVAQLVWHKKDNASFLSKKIVNLKEYILFYQKTDFFQGTKDKKIDTSKHRELVTKPSKIDKRVFDKNHLLIENGEFTGLLKAGKYGSEMFGMEILKDVYIKNGIPSDNIEIKGRFCWSQKNIEKEIEKGGRIEIKTIRGMKPIFYKNFKKDIPFRALVDILSKKIDERVTTNNDAANEIKEYFNLPIFEYSKPSKLIKLLIDNITKDDKNSIILDFFAGSGTTGDAVMQLNAEDGGNRKFILVQLPEKIDPKKNKTAYEFVKKELGVEIPTIFDITKERLVRAGKKIKENGQLKFHDVDTSFKIFETTPIWDDYLLDEKELNKDTQVFNRMLSAEELKSLFITWKTADGSPLTENYQEVKINDYLAYYVGKSLYLMFKNFTKNEIETLIKKIDDDKNFVVDKIILFGYNFESKILREIYENIGNYANKKNIEIEVVIRF